MTNINAWMQRLTQALEDTFAGRIWFVGLQGSYARGEATDTSDIDAVVILDTLDTADIQAYGALLDTLPHRDLVCGFVSGREELLGWDAADLFQFYHDTLPVKGTLDALLDRMDAAAVDRAVHLAACNLYHGCVHNMLFDKSDAVLRGLYKSAAFTVQALAYRDTGRYIRLQKDLLEEASGAEQGILETCMALKQGAPVAFEDMSQRLFDWAGGLVRGG